MVRLYTGPGSVLDPKASSERDCWWGSVRRDSSSRGVFFAGVGSKLIPLLGIRRKSRSEAPPFTILSDPVLLFYSAMHHRSERMRFESVPDKSKSHPLNGEEGATVAVVVGHYKRGALFTSADALRPQNDLGVSRGV